jgi:hypothetical protein
LIISIALVTELLLRLGMAYKPLNITSHWSQINDGIAATSQRKQFILETLF